MCSVVLPVKVPYHPYLGAARLRNSQTFSRPPIETEDSPLFSRTVTPSMHKRFLVARLTKRRRCPADDYAYSNRTRPLGSNRDCRRGPCTI